MFKILVITDTKLSSINQCNSVVNELTSSKKINLQHIKIKKSFFHFFPNSFIYLKLLIQLFFGLGFKKQRIDLIISCGRIAAPYNLIFKKINNCTNLHILNPYFKKNEFSKIIIPQYDSPKFFNKHNLILTRGTLVDRKKINLKRKQLLNISKLFNENFKIVLFLIGGSGKSSKIVFADLKETIQKINQEKKIEIVYCFSRRTPQSLKNNILKSKKKRSLVFPDNFYNPYWELINIADYFFVTADSISMTSDALSTGKPTYIIPVSKIKSKIKNFQINLNKEKITRIYNKKLSKWSYKKLEESKLVGKQLKQILKL